MTGSDTGQQQTPAWARREDSKDTAFMIRRPTQRRSVGPQGPRGKARLVACRSMPVVGPSGAGHLGLPREISGFSAAPARCRLGLADGPRDARRQQSWQDPAGPKRPMRQAQHHALSAQAPRREKPGRRP